MGFAIFPPYLLIHLLFIFWYLCGWLCLRSQEDQDIRFCECIWDHLISNNLHIWDCTVYYIKAKDTGFSKLSGKIGQILKAFCMSLLFRRLTQGLIHSIGMLMASLSTHHKLYSLQNITFYSDPGQQVHWLYLALALETEITALLLKHNCYCILKRNVKHFFFSVRIFCWWYLWPCR